MVAPTINGLPVAYHQAAGLYIITPSAWISSIPRELYMLLCENRNARGGVSRLSCAYRTSLAGAIGARSLASELADSLRLIIIKALPCISTPLRFITSSRPRHSPLISFILHYSFKRFLAPFVLRFAITRIVKMYKNSSLILTLLMKFKLMLERYRPLENIVL